MRKNKKELMAGILCLAMGTMITSTVEALPAQQMDTPNYKLNPIVITAQRTVKKAINIPASVTVLTEKDLKDTGADSLLGALSFTTGINTNSYGQGGASYGGMNSGITLRGMKNGTLVLVNGAPVSMNGSSGLDTISLSEVKKVEISRGANSVLYGADAFGGVINVITKDSGDAEGTLSLAGGNYGYRKYGASYGNDTIYASISEERFGGRERISDDYIYTPPSRNKDHYTGTGEGKDRRYALTFSPTDNWTFRYLRSERNSEYITKYLNPVTPDSYQYFKDTQNNFIASYKDYAKGWKGTAFYNNRTNYGEEQKSIDLPRTKKASNSHSYKTGFDLQKTIRFTNTKNLFVGGAAVTVDHYASTINSNEARRVDYALYGQYIWKVSPKLDITTGLRTTYVKDPLKDRHPILPQFQSLYHIDDHHSWYVNIGKAFKMPSLKEAYRTSIDPFDAARAGRNLKPQSGWNYETGYKISNGKESLTLSMYYMDFDNIFTTKGVPGKRSYKVNGGQFKNLGVEAEYMRPITDTLTVKAGASVSNPKNRESDTAPWEQTYSKLQYNLGVQYAKDKWASSLAFNFLGKRPTVEARGREDFKKPNVVILNATANYTINDDQSISLRLNNLLNRKNYITDNSIPNFTEGFNWDIGYSYKF